MNAGRGQQEEEEEAGGRTKRGTESVVVAAVEIAATLAMAGLARVTITYNPYKTSFWHTLALVNRQAKESPKTHRKRAKRCACSTYLWGS